VENAAAPWFLRHHRLSPRALLDDLDQLVLDWLAERVAHECRPTDRPLGGAQLDFQIMARPGADNAAASEQSITVFTTRPTRSMGLSYLVAGFRSIAGGPVSPPTGNA